MVKSRVSDKNVQKIDYEDKATNLNNFTKKYVMEDTKAKLEFSNNVTPKEDGIYDTLLEIHEVIRDPVHGDVGITLLEKFLIDLEIFQRMRGISQLGPTQLVYPGAVHNRFIHSIGVLHVSEQLVEICNHNYKILNKVLMERILEIKPYQHLLIRLSALLHDIAHIPFGHTLEDEGNLFPPEWEDKARSDVFQKGNTIYECIQSVLTKFKVSDETIVKTICQDLQNILIKGEYKDPFIIDIVSGNLCADLLDYTQRDMLFCGLSERWGDRFINYFSILSVIPKKEKYGDSDVFELSTERKGGKGRFILLAYRCEQDPESPQKMKWRQKMDVLSEAIDLLRKRFSLSEKVYFHRTKLAASSMLISAIASAELTIEDLFPMNHEQDVIARLLDKNINPNERSLQLARSYARRNLFKPIYKIGYKKEDETDTQALKLWNELYPYYRDPKNRLEKENYLETAVGLNPGSISIFCPDKHMNLKKFEALVHPRPDSDIKSLRHILDASRRYEMSVIENRFELLWKFEVFVDAEQVNPLDKFDSSAIELSKECENVFGFSNELNNLKVQLTDDEIIIKRLIKDWDIKNPKMMIPLKIVEEIKVSSRRSPQTRDISIEDYYRGLIENKVISYYENREKK